jgi:predicted acylesterase/phospholipase RssA
MNADQEFERGLNDEQHAIVLSGNGAYAAYEVGIMKALIHGMCPSTSRRPIRPEIYTGTSVGALNAAMVVAGADDSDVAAVENLERLWFTHVVESMRGLNGIFRLRANPFDYFRPAFYLPTPLTPLLDLGRDTVYFSQEITKRMALFLTSLQTFPSLQDIIELFDISLLIDFSPLKQLVREVIDPEKIRRSRKQLRITAANWKEGALRIFRNADLGDKEGHQAFVAALMIPGINTPELVDMEQFVDGAVLTSRPLKPAIDARDRDSNRRLVLHVVYLDPEHAQTPLPEIRSTFAMIYRLYVLAFSRSVNADIERARDINKSLQALDLLREEDPEPLTSSAMGERGSESLKLWQRLNKDTADSVQLEIHRYRSPEHLGGIRALFQVDQTRIHDLIDRGYKDAQNHDCKQSDCVLLLESES